MKAIKKLGTVLHIFGRAEYYPINNDVYTENHDLGMRYRRLLAVSSKTVTPMHCNNTVLICVCACVYMGLILVNGWYRR